MRLGIAVAEGVSIAHGDLLARVDALPAVPAYVPVWCSWDDTTDGPPGREFPRDIASRLIARGIMPVVYWHPTGTAYSHASILAGEWDVYLDRWASAARAWDGTVLVRFAHEQNGHWFGWSPGGSVQQPIAANTSESYIAMWRYVVARVQAIAPHLLWWWCPNANPAATISDTYPGDAWVNRVGFDGYAWHDPVQSPADIYGPAFYRMRDITDKPLIVSEFGVAAGTTDRRAWFNAAIDWFTIKRITGAIYFSIDTRDIKQKDWRLASLPSIRNAWARAVERGHA